jgi:hypothetical protein
MRLLTVGMLLFSSIAVARFRWKDLDPFNRDSAVRDIARSLDPSQMRAKVTRNVAVTLASDGSIQHQVRGWTQDRCRGSLAAIALPIVAIKAVTLCGAMVEPISIGACITAVGTCTAGIVDATCTQLCHDHHLRDCK